MDRTAGLREVHANSGGGSCHDDTYVEEKAAWVMTLVLKDFHRTLVMRSHNAMDIFDAGTKDSGVCANRQTQQLQR